VDLRAPERLLSVQYDSDCRQVNAFPSSRSTSGGGGGQEAEAEAEGKSSQKSIGGKTEASEVEAALRWVPDFLDYACEGRMVFVANPQQARAATLSSPQSSSPPTGSKASSGSSYGSGTALVPTASTDTSAAALPAQGRPEQGSAQGQGVVPSRLLVCAGNGRNWRSILLSGQASAMTLNSMRTLVAVGLRDGLIVIRSVLTLKLICCCMCPSLEPSLRDSSSPSSSSLSPQESQPDSLRQEPLSSIPLSKGGQQLQASDTHDFATCLRFTPRGTHLLVGTHSGCLRVFALPARSTHFPVKSKDSA